jgi:DNA polymerase I
MSSTPTRRSRPCERSWPIPERPKLGQHLKYDLNVLERAGVNWPASRTTPCSSPIVYHSTATRHDLDSLAGRYLGRQTTSSRQVAGKGKQQVTFDQVPVATAADYAGEDAEVTLALHQTLWPKLEAHGRPRASTRNWKFP